MRNFYITNDEGEQVEIVITKHSDIWLAEAFYDNGELIDETRFTSEPDDEDVIFALNIDR